MFLGSEHVSRCTRGRLEQFDIIPCLNLSFQTHLLLHAHSKIFEANLSSIDGLHIILLREISSFKTPDSVFVVVVELPTIVRLVTVVLESIQE